jgi:hypothetical protein
MPIGSQMNVKEDKNKKLKYDISPTIQSRFLENQTTPGE